MKRFLCLLAALVVMMSAGWLSAFAETTDDSLEWHQSEDGVISFAIVSVDNSSYPKIKITMKYKVDEELASSSYWTYDASNAVSQYIHAHPQYKNRKVKINAEIEEVYARREGIQYAVKIKVSIGGENSDYYYAGLNLWEEFPDEFIDYDAYRIASGIKLYQEKGGVYNPSALTISGNARMDDSSEENIVLYKISVNGMNRAGGYVNETIVIVYNEQTGLMDLVNDDCEYIYRQGATNRKNASELFILYYSVGESDTQISQRVVEAAMRN